MSALIPWALLTFFAAVAGYVATLYFGQLSERLKPYVDAHLDWLARRLGRFGKWLHRRPDATAAAPSIVTPPDPRVEAIRAYHSDPIEGLLWKWKWVDIDPESPLLGGIVDLTACCPRCKDQLVPILGHRLVAMGHRKPEAFYYCKACLTPGVHLVGTVAEIHNDIKREIRNRGRRRIEPSAAAGDF